MPKKFKFFVNNAITFQCQLQSVRCDADSNNGNRCKNTSVIGTPLCWRHLLKLKKVRILDSQYGKGLFAMDSTKGQNDIVFRENQTIVQYEGERLRANEVERRYGINTAPYAVDLGNGYIDSACLRGVGSLINHAPQAKRNCRFSFPRAGGIQIKATKNIRNNKELFLNYNEGHERGDNRYKFVEQGVRHNTR
jgi:hypothetical protein